MRRGCVEREVGCVLDGLQLHADQSLDRSKVIELLVITERKGNPGGAGLPRARLGEAKHVFAGESLRNGLLLDWSVRRVGIKELWTLKWHLQFDTANAWTKAGGALAEDWPEWMRGFEDY